MWFKSKLAPWMFVGIVAAGGIASLIWRPQPPPQQVLATGELLHPSRSLGDFSLIDHQGRSFGPANLRGRWSLMFFGYSHCPAFCPATLTTLAALQKNLRAAKAVAPPQVIFVSVDAERDTPAQLAKYVPYFDPEFIGLTAPDQASIETLAKNWGVAVSVQPATDGDYSVDHSSAIFVIDPAGNLAAILTGPFTLIALQTDFTRMAGRGT
jgi:protein SCO1/2